jgi:carbonic anhydrase
MTGKTWIGLVVLWLTAGPGLASEQSHWSYAGDTGPEHWGSLAEEWALCGEGTRQSPIDVGAAVPARLPPLEFDYRSWAETVINNGHTIQFDVPPGSTLHAGVNRYRLVQFHFHTPSEHVRWGLPAPGELHLVHKAEDGTLAVVGVWLVPGRWSGRTFSSLWGALPTLRDQRYPVRALHIDPEDLLPTRRDYVYYRGSLTTPPCTEGVEWFVLAEPVEVPPGLLQRLSQIMGLNARPVQPLNGRTPLRSR